MKPLLPQDEKTLVRLSLAGDRRAQFGLYERYVRAMYHTVIRMVPRTADAEDIVQESFSRVFEYLPTFKGDSTIGAWIKSVVIRTTLNFIRKNSRIQWVDIEETGIGKWQEEEEPTPMYSMETVHHAVKRLPEGCREIFCLYLLEGLQHKEIAEELGITESTSKSQYRRAKHLLKEILTQQPVE